MVTEPRHDAFVESEYTLSLRGPAQIIWKRLWIIALVAVLFTGTAVGLSLSQTPQYEASTKILVGQEQGIADNPGNALGLQQLTQTMAEAAGSRPVAEAVIQRLGLQMSPNSLLGGLNVEPIPETQFIQVSYRGSDPDTAQRIANTVGEVFSEQISEVSPSAITATVWEEATVPFAPVSPNPVRNGLLALVIGSMLGVGLAFLLEYLDDSWQSSEEAEQISGVPTFGVIPEFKALKGKKRGKG